MCAASTVTACTETYCPLLAGVGNALQLVMHSTSDLKWALSSAPEVVFNWSGKAVLNQGNLTHIMLRKKTTETV